MWDGINRRSFPRADYPCKIKVQTKKGKTVLSSKTDNIGCGGICTILSANPGLFSDVTVEIDLQDGFGNNLAVEGTVVWVVRRHEIKHDRVGCFDVGIEFKPLSEENKNRIEKIVEKCLQKE